MSKSTKIAGTVEAWENGELGQDAKHAQRADSHIESQIEEALGMQSISIRLPSELINEFKMIAKVNGLGYQPLMRDALKRFAESEIKKMAIAYANLRADADKKKAEEVAPPDLPDRKLAA